MRTLNVRCTSLVSRDVYSDSLIELMGRHVTKGRKARQRRSETAMTFAMMEVPRGTEMEKVTGFYLTRPGLLMRGKHQCEKEKRWWLM